MVLILIDTQTGSRRTIVVPPKERCRASSAGEATAVARLGAISLWLRLIGGDPFLYLPRLSTPRARMFSSSTARVMISAPAQASSIQSWKGEPA